MKINSLVKVGLGSITIGMLLIGCGTEEGTNILSPSNGGGTNNGGGTTVSNALKVTYPSADKIKIEWQRTGQVKYGVYTQLEVKNSRTYKLASTNNDNKIIINCTRTTIESDKVNYKCKPDNTGNLSYNISLSPNSKNIVQEKGGNQTGKILTIGEINVK